MNRLLLLLNYNLLLSKRLQLRLRAPYIGGALFLLAIFCLISIFALTDDLTPKKTSLYFFLFLYMYIVSSMFFLTARYANDSIVLPLQLSSFPISSRFLYWYLLCSLMTDVKSLLYFFPFGILAKRVFAVSISAGLFSVLVLMLFFFLIDVWMLVAYMLLHSFLSVHKKNVSIAACVAYFIYLIAVSRGSAMFQRLAETPPLSWFGASIAAGMVHNWSAAFLYVFYSTVAIVMGLIIGIALSYRARAAF